MLCDMLSLHPRTGTRMESQRSTYHAQSDGKKVVTRHTPMSHGTTPWITPTIFILNKSVQNKFGRSWTSQPGGQAAGFRRRATERAGRLEADNIGRPGCQRRGTISNMCTVLI